MWFKGFGVGVLALGYGVAVWLVVCKNTCRGVYSGKSDCLVLPKNLAFYGKPAKTVMCLD